MSNGLLVWYARLATIRRYGEGRWGTHVVTSHIDLRQSHELVAVRTRLYHFLQREVHPCVAVDEVAVERFAVFELDEHGVALGRVEET